eukprot:RCo014862
MSRKECCRNTNEEAFGSAHREVMEAEEVQSHQKGSSILRKPGRPTRGAFGPGSSSSLKSLSSRSSPSLLSRAAGSSPSSTPEGTVGTEGRSAAAEDALAERLALLLRLPPGL